MKKKKKKTILSNFELVLTKKRLVKIETKPNNDDIDEVEQTSSDHHEFITGMNEATDDDGSIAYIENIEINENERDDENPYFVEYVTEDDDNIIADDQQNDTEFETDQFTEYADDDEMNDELYNCNLCGMNFKSITEHVEKYHSGEEVLIDVLEKSGSAIKTEAIDPLDRAENDDAEYDEEDSMITSSDNYSINDGELIVYDRQYLRNDDDIIDELTDEDDQQEVYTYDGTTGSITRTVKSNVRVTFRYDLLH